MIHYHKRIFLLWGLIIFLFIFLAGCTIYAVSETQQESGAEQKNIIKKNYAKAPLSRSQLKQLIEMTVYTGPAEEYGNIYLDRQAQKGKGTPVLFSHQKHRRHFTCKVCHTELEFSLSKGDTDITREDYLDGRYCGACHNGKIAFSTEFACDACHLESTDKRVRTAPQTDITNTSTLPQTSYGDHINWVKAIEEGAVQPSGQLPGQASLPVMPLPAHLTSPMFWTTAEPRILVRFPHSDHIKWLDCSNCHPDIFSIKHAGTIAFDKEANLYGRFCGTCHMNVAFPMNGCNRCHPGVMNYTVRKD